MVTTHIARPWPEGVVETAVSQEAGARQQWGHPGSPSSGSPSPTCTADTSLGIAVSVPSLEPPGVLGQLPQIRTGECGWARGFPLGLHSQGSE